MRFIITAQPGKDSAAPDPNAPFDEELFSTYMRFNEEMHRAGVLVAAEGLKPGGEVRPHRSRRGRRGVVDGPVHKRSKELVGGLYIIEVDSQEEAGIQWGAEVPDRARFQSSVLEIRGRSPVSPIPCRGC